MVSLGYGFKSYVGCRIKQVCKNEVFSATYLSSEIHVIARQRQISN